MWICCTKIIIRSHLLTQLEAFDRKSEIYVFVGKLQGLSLNVTKYIKVVRDAGNIEHPNKW